MNDAVAETMSQAVGEDVTEKLNIYQQFFETLPQKALGLGIRVVLALVFFFVGVQVIKIIRKVLKKSLLRANADIGVVQFLDSFVKAALYIVLLFMIASSFGLDATSVVAVVGSAGVAIGLALQGSLSNLAGGVLILLLKPFKVGDYIIEDTNKNEGTVTEIQIFYTKLTTPDERTVVLPNGTLANSSLTNVTDIGIRRLDMTVGISYKADLKLAKETAKKLLTEDVSTLKNKEIDVFVSDLGESAVILNLRCYVKTEDYWPTRSRILEAVKLTFDEEGIEIPYPQMDVHVK
ncbi:MAG: mechanosensitive ion channel family protein [Lachnospiraceae bacterium]|nr:mechanosensitive ion channel family protein [Lachnospiraceae bacterium]